MQKEENIFNSVDTKLKWWQKPRFVYNKSLHVSTFYIEIFIKQKNKKLAFHTFNLRIQF